MLKYQNAAIVAVMAALVSCSDSNSPNNPAPMAATVTATTSQTFDPKTVQVATGGAVTWKFQSLGHNVTFDNVAGAPADIGGVNSNTSIARTFATNGTFTYHCTIHPGMTGTVQVVSPAVTTTSSSSDGGGAPVSGY